MKRHVLPLFLVALWIALPGLQAQQAYIIAPNGQRLNVERILARPDGSLVVTVDGQPRELTPEQYKQAVGVKPSGWDAALAERDTDVLREVFRKSAYQSWDALAGNVLIEEALRAGDAAEAARTLGVLVDRYGEALTELFPEIEMMQWKIRVATGDTEGLEAELTEVIRESDNRARRGMAQLARGDLKQRRKDFTAAVLDYLRAVYFYADLPGIHAEALYKAADAFADLGDSARMRTYQQQLASTYPDSAYADMPVGD